MFALDIDKRDYLDLKESKIRRKRKKSLTLPKHLPRHGIEFMLQLVDQIIHSFGELALGICALVTQRALLVSVYVKETNGLC